MNRKLRLQSASVQSKQLIAHGSAGRRPPPANSIALICKACGVSSDYLLGLSDDPKAARAVSIENGSANAVNSAHAHIETTVPQCRDCPHLARLLDLLAKGKRNA